MEEQVRVVAKRDYFCYDYQVNPVEKKYILLKDNEYVLTLFDNRWGEQCIKFTGDDGVSREYSMWYRKYYFKDLKEKPL